MKSNSSIKEQLLDSSSSPSHSKRFSNPTTPRKDKLKKSLKSFKSSSGKEHKESLRTLQINSTSQSDREKHKEKFYKENRTFKLKRGVMLTIFSWSGLVQMILALNIVPISVSLQSGYNVDPFQIALIDVVGSLTSLVSFIPVSIFLNKVGIKWGLVCGFFLVCLGLSVEQFIKYNWNYVYVASFLIRMGASTYFMAKGVFIEKWYFEKERNFALSLQEIMLNVGYLTANILISFFVNNTGGLTPADIREGVEGYLLLVLGMAILTFLLLLFVFRAEPKYPISRKKELTMMGSMHMVLSFGTSFTSANQIQSFG